MILAFLLVVTVAGEKVSDESMLFKNIYRCNAFATAIENGKKTPHDSRRNPQQNIIAYCVPKMVNENSKFWD